MQNQPQSNNQNNIRLKIIGSLLIPQLIILGISILWIFIFPKDTIINYFKFNFLILFEGILTGIGLAISGYGFYKLAKKYSHKIKAFSELTYFFEEMLSLFIKNLKFPEIFLVSFTSGFCEEVLFRGLLVPKFGIILSSLGFGALHIPSGKDKRKIWIYAIWATLSGALLAWLFVLSGSLWLSISAHVTNNLIGMILLKRLKN